MRVFHICISDELKDDFVSRDKKLTRAELDANCMNSFWQKAAVMYNDEKVTFTLLMVVALAQRAACRFSTTLHEHMVFRTIGVDSTRKRCVSRSIRVRGKYGVRERTTGPHDRATTTRPSAGLKITAREHV